MDEREAALARAVAETVDAWLRDPRHAALYARLLIAVEAWRARRSKTDDGPTTSVDQPAEDIAEQATDGPGADVMQVSAATAALIEKLRRIQADAHKREHPPACGDRRRGTSPGRGRVDLTATVPAGWRAAQLVVRKEGGESSPESCVRGEENQCCPLPQRGLVEEKLYHLIRDRVLIGSHAGTGEEVHPIGCLRVGSSHPAGWDAHSGEDLVARSAEEVLEVACQKFEPVTVLGAHREAAGDVAAAASYDALSRTCSPTSCPGARVRSMSHFLSDVTSQ